MLRHCSSCHLPVPATWLDRETWSDEVLPAMAPYLGIGALWGDQYYRIQTEDNRSSPSASLTIDERQKIADNFDSAATERITIPEPSDRADTSMPVFQVIEAHTRMR